MQVDNESHVNAEWPCCGKCSIAKLKTHQNFRALSLRVADGEITSSNKDQLCAKKASRSRWTGDGKFNFSAISTVARDHFPTKNHHFAPHGAQRLTFLVLCPHSWQFWHTSVGSQRLIILPEHIMIIFQRAEREVCYTFRHVSENVISAARCTQQKQHPKRERCISAWTTIMCHNPLIVGAVETTSSFALCWITRYPLPVTQANFDSEK